MDQAYWDEFRAHWRVLLAATIGLGFGIGLSAYTTSLFAPHLLAEFGWSKSGFALLGTFSLLMLITQPITGRLTDRYGVKKVATVGVLGAPVAYFMYATLTGDIRMFYTASIVQLIIGTVTTSPVYTRLIAERFVRARGLAFSIVMAGPPIAGFFAAPLLDAFIDAYGWRSGYYMLAAVTFAAGVVALLMIPSHHPSVDANAARPESERKADWPLILKSRAFWIVIAGMLLINIPQTLISSQM